MKPRSVAGGCWLVAGLALTVAHAAWAAAPPGPPDAVAACPVVAPPPSSAPSAGRPEAPRPACFSAAPDRSCFTPRPTCETDLRVAKIAWKYFENNYHPTTGLVNAADKYPSTTEWDAASALAGTIAARELELISGKEFDDRITAFLATLNTQKLFNDVAPNKAYNTATGAMTDYNNNPSTGIGYSALDLARLVSWLSNLACLHPRHAHAAKLGIERWKLGRVLHDGQMYGTYVDSATKAVRDVQEGRLGYEQYGGKIFASLGFDQSVAASYRNPYASTVTILGVPIAVDTRDPRKLGAYNYVVTESYALDAMELGLDSVNTPLARNIFEVQKRRWQKTGIVTAVSEDNIDRAPYFLYNTIYAAGSAWNTITDTGADFDSLKSVSVKAAFSLAALFPLDPYSGVLVDRVASAYDPDRGYFSGVYESGIGYNKAITVNTNGIVLEALLFKRLGSVGSLCQKCGRSLKITPPPRDCACTPPRGGR